MIIIVLFFASQHAWSQLFKAHNTCQQRRMFSPSRSSLTALYILDPLSALSSLPAPVCCLLPSVSSLLSSLSSPLLSSVCAVQRALPGFLKYARDTKQGFTSYTASNQIKLSCQFYPLVLCVKLRPWATEQLDPTGQLRLMFQSGPLLMKYVLLSHRRSLSKCGICNF